MALPRAGDESRQSLVPGRAWNAVVDFVARVGNLIVQQPLWLRNTPNGILIGIDLPDSGHWAKIGENAKQDPNYQWAYSSVQVYKDDTGLSGWLEMPGGIETSSEIDSDTPPAWNTYEVINGSSGLTGIGVSVSGIAGNTGSPPPLELQPVPEGSIVWMRKVYSKNGTGEFWFSAANGIDGTCP